MNDAVFSFRIPFVAVVAVCLGGSGLFGCSTIPERDSGRQGLFQYLNSTSTGSPASRSMSGNKRLRLARLSARDWGWPLRSVSVTSQFGRRKGRMHEGIDLRATSGTPVFAAAPGKVVYSASRLSGYGRMIVVRHPNDLFTLYAHLSKSSVRAGDWVGKGEMIGRSGSTGRVTAPHLHFEVRSESEPLNPVHVLPDRSRTLAAQ